MDVEQVRGLLRRLPHAVETMQWGANLVYRVGDKAIGGKMFALINLDEDRNPLKPTPVIMFYVGPERYGELIENEGFVPAPYMARIYWVALTAWNVVRPTELTALLREANEGVRTRLPKRTLTVLAMPKPERDDLIEQRTRALSERAANKQKSPKPTKQAVTENRTAKKKKPGSRKA